MPVTLLRKCAGVSCCRLSFDVSSLLRSLAVNWRPAVLILALDKLHTLESATIVMVLSFYLKRNKKIKIFFHPLLELSVHLMSSSQHHGPDTITRHQTPKLIIHSTLLYSLYLMHDLIQNRYLNFCLDKTQDTQLNVYGL